jgi:hypothetical protein
VPQHQVGLKGRQGQSREKLRTRLGHLRLLTTLKIELHLPWADFTVQAQ